MSNIDIKVLLIAIKDLLGSKFNEEQKIKLDRYDACIMNSDDWGKLDSELNSLTLTEKDKSVRNTAILFRIIIAYQNLTTAPRGEVNDERSINAKNIINSSDDISAITSGERFKEFYNWLITSEIDASIKSIGKIYLFRALLYKLTTIKFVDNDSKAVDGKQILNLLSGYELMHLLANGNARKRYRQLVKKDKEDIVISFKDTSKPSEILGMLTGSSKGVVRTTYRIIMSAEKTQKINPDGAQLFNQFDEKSFNGYCMDNEGYSNYLALHNELFSEIKKLSKFLTDEQNDKLGKIEDYIKFSLDMCNYQVINEGIDAPKALEIYKKRYQVIESQITYYMTSVLHDIAVSIAEQIKVSDGGELTILNRKDCETEINGWGEKNADSNNILLTHDGKHENWHIHGKRKNGDIDIDVKVDGMSHLHNILAAIKKRELKFNENVKTAVFKCAEELLGRKDNKKYKLIDKLLANIYLDTELLRSSDEIIGSLNELISDDSKKLLGILQNIYKIAPIYGKQRKEKKLDLTNVVKCSYSLEAIINKITELCDCDDAGFSKSDFMQDSSSVVSSAQIPNPMGFYLEMEIAADEFKLIVIPRLHALIDTKAGENKKLAGALNGAVETVKNRLFNINSDTDECCDEEPSVELEDPLSDDEKTTKETKVTLYSTDKIIAIYGALQKFIEDTCANKNFKDEGVVWEDAKRAVTTQLNNAVMQIVHDMISKAKDEAETRESDQNYRDPDEKNQFYGQLEDDDSGSQTSTEEELRMESEESDDDYDSDEESEEDSDSDSDSDFDSYSDSDDSDDDFGVKMLI